MDSIYYSYDPNDTDNDGDFLDALSLDYGITAQSSSSSNSNSAKRHSKTQNVTLTNDTGDSQSDGYTNSPEITIIARKPWYTYTWTLYSADKTTVLKTGSGSFDSTILSKGINFDTDGTEDPTIAGGNNGSNRLADGDYYLEVIQVNGHGRAAKKSFMEFTLDRTNPDEVGTALHNDTDNGKGNNPLGHHDFYTKEAGIDIAGLDDEGGSRIPNVWYTSANRKEALSDSELAQVQWRQFDRALLTNNGDGTWKMDISDLEGWGDGTVHVYVKQVDRAGNESKVNHLTFTLDRRSNDFSADIAQDTGRDKADRITNNGNLRLDGIEAGNYVEYKVEAITTVDGVETITSNDLWSTTYNPIEGKQRVSVRVTDNAGNERIVQVQDFTLKGKAHGVVLGLKNDTGSRGNGKFDKVTKDPTLDIQGQQPDEILTYSTDGGTTWSSSFNAKNGLNNLIVRAEDIAGNTADSSYSFVYKNSVGKVGVGLKNDTGRSAVDKITKDGTLQFSGIENGALVEYSIDGGTTWTSSFAPKEGFNSVKVRQTDIADNVSDVTTHDFTLKTNVKGMWIGLKNDTGKSKFDFVTRDATLDLIGTEDGALVEYSVDGGQTWSSTFTAKNGRNDVMVRQTDLAANTSTTSSMSFLLKTSVNGVGVGLKNDSGANKFDGYTNDSTLNLTGVELDATVEYSTDGGLTWASSFTPTQGRNSILVRQTDTAGNISDPTAMSFVYKTSVNKPAWGLTYDTGKSNVDKITKFGAINLSGVEDGATVQYSYDGGLSWTNSFSAKEGKNAALVRQIDMFGNVSDATSIDFTLDSRAPTAMKWNHMKSMSESDLPTMSAIATLGASDDMTTSDFTFMQSPGNSFFNISEKGAINRNSTAVASNTTSILTATVQDQAGNAYSKSFAVVTGSASADKISGQSYDEAIYALDGNDFVSGNAGSDVLYGQGGNDTLIGGAGQDVLYGGAGADNFKLNLASDSASLATSDLIADFVQGSDKIDLLSLDGNTSTTKREAFMFASTPTMGVVKNSVTYYQDTVKGQTIVQADTNGDAIANVVLTMTGLYSLKATDFML